MGHLMARKVNVSLLDEMEPKLIVASTTIDGAMWKGLYAFVGKVQFRVTKRSVTEIISNVIYEGDNFAEAVRLYNGMG